MAAAEATAAGAPVPTPRHAPDRADPGHYHCSRCGEPIGSLPAEWANVSDLGIDLCELPFAAGPAELPLSFGSRTQPDLSPAARVDAWQWELDQELHDVRRLLKRRGNNGEAIEWQVVDAPESLPPVLSVPQTERSTALPGSMLAASAAPASDDLRPWTPLAWIILMTGLTAACCGGALLAWSELSGRHELWIQGVPILSGGLVALLVALVAMLLRARRQSQLTAARLRERDSLLSALSGPVRDESAHLAQHPFYRHLAEGAAPHRLLSDLKDQIDLLAVRLNRQRS